MDENTNTDQDTIIAERAAAIRAGVTETRPLTELADELGFDIDDLRDSA